MHDKWQIETGGIAKTVEQTQTYKMEDMASATQKNPTLKSRSHEKLCHRAMRRVNQRTIDLPRRDAMNREKEDTIVVTIVDEKREAPIEGKADMMDTAGMIARHTTAMATLEEDTAVTTAMAECTAKIW